MRTRRRSTITLSDSRYIRNQTIPNSQVLYSATFPVASVQGTDQLIVDESDGRWRTAQRSGQLLVRPVDNVRATITPRNTVFSTQGRQTGPGGMVIDWVDSCSIPRAMIYLKPYYLALEVGSPDWSTFRDKWYPSQVGFSSQYEQARCLEQCYAKASQSAALVAVTIAEAEKTLASVRRLHSLVPRFNDWLYRNKHVLFTKTGVWRATGTLASQWLEYRYGFAQLYYDVSSYCKAMSPGGKRRLESFTYTKRYSHTGGLCVVSDDKSYPYYDTKSSFQRFREDKISAGIICEADDPIVAKLRAFGALSPLSSAWEMVKWSWLIDWAIGVSDTLAAWEGRLSRRVLASWTSHRIQMKGLYHVERRGKITTDGVFVWNGAGSNCDLLDEEEVTQYIRTANPSLQFMLPEVRLKMSANRALDLASLLRGLKRDAYRL